MIISIFLAFNIHLINNKIQFLGFQIKCRGLATAMLYKNTVLNTLYNSSIYILFMTPWLSYLERNWFNV